MKTRRKILFVIGVAIVIISGVLGYFRTQEAPHELLVYTYDSFASEWGPGPKLVSKFESNYGIKVNLQSVGDAGQVLQRAVFEKKSPQADVLIGIDNNLLERALEEDILEPYKSSIMDTIPEHLHFDSTYHLLPYDYGYFAIIYDSAHIDSPPASLEDLTHPKYENSLILMDPRTSTPGFGFLLWTAYVYGDELTAYWGRLKPSILTITDGWDSGYGLFTAGEAPLVLSYTTSPAYHIEYEDTDRYRSALFKEGHYTQVEGIGIVKNSRNRDKAELFIDFVLSTEFQEIIPTTNWMYPVHPEAELPESFVYAPLPEIHLPKNEWNYDSEELIRLWTEIMTN